jgi:hypothetical protein
MLLTKEADTIENLTRSGSRGFETLFQIRVFDFQTFDSFGIYPRTTRRRLVRFHTSFGLKRSPPERCKLVSEVYYELMQLFESLKLRTFAV